MMREIIIISVFCCECIGVYRMSERDYYYYGVFFVRCIGVYRMMREIIIIMVFLFEWYRGI